MENFSAKHFATRPRIVDWRWHASGNGNCWTTAGRPLALTARNSCKNCPNWDLPSALPGRKTKSTRPWLPGLFWRIRRKVSGKRNKADRYSMPSLDEKHPRAALQLDPQLQLVFPLLSAASCLEDV